MSTPQTALDYILGTSHVPVSTLSGDECHNIILHIREILSVFLHHMPVFKLLDKDEREAVSPEQKDAKFFKGETTVNLDQSLSLIAIRHDGCIFDGNIHFQDGVVHDFRLKLISRWHDRDLFIRTLFALNKLVEANEQLVLQWASNATRLQQTIGRIRGRLKFNC